MWKPRDSDSSVACVKSELTRFDSLGGGSHACNVSSATAKNVFYLGYI